MAQPFSGLPWNCDQLRQSSPESSKNSQFEPHQLVRTHVFGMSVTKAYNVSAQHSHVRAWERWDIWVVIKFIILINFNIWCIYYTTNVSKTAKTLNVDWWFSYSFNRKYARCCRSRKMLNCAPFRTTIGVDTTENRPITWWCRAWLRQFACRQLLGAVWRHELFSALARVADFPAGPNSAVWRKTPIPYRCFENVSSGSRCFCTSKKVSTDFEAFLLS